MAEWGYNLEDSLPHSQFHMAGPDGRMLDDKYLTGMFSLTPHCVQIKDPKQPEDYNLGWFVFEKLEWSPETHHLFPEAVKGQINALLMCIRRLNLRIRLPKKILSDIICGFAETDETELVAFVWDPYYGIMECKGCADFGNDIVAKWDPEGAGNG